MIKKLSAALVGATFVLAGCNTMSGMGQDIKAGGEKLEKKAEDVKHGSSENASKHEHGAMAAQPTETMTKESSSSDSSMWDKTKEKASEIKDSAKEKASELKDSAKEKFSK